jgi:hypothetical protein
MVLANEWVSKWTQTRNFLKKYSMPHHGIFPIYFWHMELMYDMGQYSMPCHGIFCHNVWFVKKSTMIYWF